MGITRLAKTWGSLREAPAQDTSHAAFQESPMTNMRMGGGGGGGGGIGLSVSNGQRCQGASGPVCPTQTIAQLIHPKLASKSCTSHK